MADLPLVGSGLAMENLHCLDYSSKIIYKCHVPLLCQKKADGNMSIWRLLTLSNDDDTWFNKSKRMSANDVYVCDVNIHIHNIYIYILCIYDMCS